MPETTAGRDMATLVRDGIVDSMSFGFQKIQDAWSEDRTSRELIELRLWEVSPVTGWPAYEATSATVRELAEAAGVDPDEFLDALRILHSVERFTPEQRDALMAVINTRTDTPVIASSIATWRARLDEKRRAG